MATQPPVQDLLRGIDFTALASISGVSLNVGIDATMPNIIDTTNGVAFVLTTTDTALGVPNVPNPEQAVNYNKWRMYLWNRIPFVTATSKNPTLYSWNPSSNSDVILLKWLTTQINLDILTAQVATNTADIATVTATAAQASSDAANALNNSTAAQTAATNAVNTAATASANATTANTAATAANTLAGTANATAAAAGASAATGITNAAAALAAAQVAQNLATTTVHRAIYDVAGTYNWICPVGVILLTKIKLWASGGGGGSGSGATVGGGGSGQYVEKNNYVVVPGNLYPIVVGAGGAAGTDGNDSTFNTAVAVAKAGKGGGLAVGAGGTGGTGDMIFNGYPGGLSGSTLERQGGDSPNGHAGALPPGGAGSGGAGVGKNGVAPSAGASGGSGGGNAGGVGGDGRCELFF